VIIAILQTSRQLGLLTPPYQFGGEHYKESNRAIDFSVLSEWCKSRVGQVIVCENTKADWLPFVAIAQAKSTIGTINTEAIWCNDVAQLSLM
jgi:hypothetical protein